MFFRNLTLFRFSPAVAAGLDGLEEALAAHRLRPCGPLELATGGFGWTAARPGPNAAVPDAGVQLGLLWLGFAGVYMGMRALTLGWRARRDDWMRLGVV